MATSVPFEDLQRAHHELQSLEMKHPEAYEDFVDFFIRNRSQGYKNLCRMLMGQQTPEELKGLDTDDGEAADQQ